MFRDSFAHLRDRRPVNLGECQFDLEGRVLRHADGTVAELRPQAWSVLRLLAASPGRLVSKEQFMAAIWPDVVVTDGSLAQAVSDLRAALGPHGHRLIRTVARRGYLLVPEAAEAAEAAEARPAAALPAARPLAGREHDLLTLAGLLGSRRLVTLTGAGGIGKTALALHAAHREAAAGRRVAWVDLAAMARPASVPAAVGHALQLPPAAADPTLPQPIDRLQPLDALLVLDNAEHLVDAVAPLARHLLDRAPAVRLLVTSQVPLGIDDEQVFRLRALALPDPGAPLLDAMRCGAVALFVRQAGAADLHFSATEANIATIGAVCRHLDGNALAIRLAAACVPRFGLAGLAEQLGRRLNLLAGSGRDQPARQRTLAAAFDWSHSLLGPDEQRVFRSLGSFAGPFRPLWVDQLLGELPGEDGDGADPSGSVFAILGELVDRSLVEADPAGRGQLRLLESARLYALQRQAEAGETRHLQRRHARTLALRLAHQAARLYAGRLSRDGFVAARQEAIDELRAAMIWSLSPEGDADIALALVYDAAPFCEGLALQADGARWVAELASLANTPESSLDAVRLQCAALHWNASWTGAHREGGAMTPLAVADAPSRLADPRRRAHGLCVAAREAVFQGRHADAQVLVERALAGQGPDWPGWLRALPLHLSALARLFHRPDEAEVGLRAALAQLQAEPLGDSAAAFAISFNLALSVWLQERWDEAAGLMQALLEEPRDSHERCWIYLYLALARIEQGRQGDVAGPVLEGLPHLRRAGVLGLCANGLALIAARLGCAQQAAQLLGANEAFVARSGWQHNRIGLRLQAACRDVLASIASADRIDAWLAEGRRFDDDAIESASRAALQRPCGPPA